MNYQMGDVKYLKNVVQEYVTLDRPAQNIPACLEQKSMALNMNRFLILLSAFGGIYHGNRPQ